MPDLANKLRGAIPDRETLATVTDGLTEEIALLEREVSELRLGVSESIPLGNKGPPLHLWFRKEGKVWRFMVVGETVNAIPLINASRELRLIAVDHLPELIAKLVDSSRSRVAVVQDKTDAVRALRDSLKARPAPEEFVTDDAAREASAQYVHNLRVRYEGLLTVVRNENERLHMCVREADRQAMGHFQAYCNLFDLAESVFCGSQGDLKLLNPDALTKLMEVVRERAHEDQG